MKSDRQHRLEAITKRLKNNPATMRRLRARWDVVCKLLSPCFIAAKLKSYEAHHRLEHARASFLEAYDDGVPENRLWIYALHAVKCPAAPHPKMKDFDGL